jgi:hypothetical protein
MREAYLKLNPNNPRAAVAFGRRLVPPIPTLFAVSGGQDRNDPTGQFPPEYRYWHSEEATEREPSYADARPRVLDYWRLREARKKARSEAEKIIEDVRKNASQLNESGRTLDYLRRWSARDHLGKVFDMKDVRRLRRPIDTVPVSGHEGLGAMYTRWEVDPSKIAYPRDNFVDVLMRMEKPGDAVQFSDSGESKYYVAVLLSRRPPRTDEFLAAYAAVGGLPPGGSPPSLGGPTFVNIWEGESDRARAEREMMAQLSRQYGIDLDAAKIKAPPKGIMQEHSEELRKQVMAQLRREASPESVDASGNWNLPEGVTKKQKDEND